MSETGMVLPVGESQNAEQVGERLKPAEPAPPVSEVAAVVAEIAQDMLDLLRQVRSLEARQAELGDRMESLARTVEESAFRTGKAVDVLRRDVLEERRALAARHSFDAVVPVLDSLRSMLGGLQDPDEAAARETVAVVVSALSNLVQALGYQPFEAEVGAVFDPSRMEALGFGVGAAGHVVAAVRPGYASTSLIVRPAGVRVGRPPVADDSAAAASALP